MKKKIEEKTLIIAFHAYGPYMYPHLKALIDNLSEKSHVKYFHFRDRGLFRSISVAKSFVEYKYFLNRFRIIFIRSIVDTIKVLKFIKESQVIIAVDIYVYCIVSFLLNFYSNKKIVLWSHDIITVEDEYYKNCFVRVFFKFAQKCLRKHERVIIQSQDRLELLCETYSVNIKRIDCFLLPVSLNRIHFSLIEEDRTLKKKLTLMQMGGIDIVRRSDKVIEAYQKDGDLYRLILHGYISKCIKNLITNKENKPLLSEYLIESEKLYQIIDFCDIGIIGYGYAGENYYYMQHSSGQLVEFLRSGKPIISIGSDNDLGGWVEELKVGVFIEDESQLGDAVMKIREKYEKFSLNAKKCFEKYYDITLYVGQLSNWLETLDERK